MVDSVSWFGSRLAGFRRPVGPWWLGLGYGGLLLVVDSLTRALSSDSGARARGWLSTNLETLTGAVPHAVAALVGSAFVGEDSVGWWALFGAAGLVVAGRGLGAWRTLWLVAFAHVVATFVSEGVLAARIAAGAAGADQRTILDVGPSYVVVTALVAGVAYGRRWERVVPAAGFLVLTPYLFGGLTQLDVAPVGHTTCLVLALGVGAELRRRGARGVVPEPAEPAAPVTP